MALHVVMLVVVGLFALAGVWQLDRLAQRREHNTLVTGRGRMPERSIREFLESPNDATYRHAVARGRYDVAREVILRGRGNNGRPGNHVLTPLLMKGGRAVIVDRGWVPSRLDSPAAVDALPPQDETVVRGLVLPSEGSGPFSPSPTRGPLEEIARIDVARLGAALPYKTFPSYLLLREQDPAQAGALPAPASLPSLEEGPHLAYAIQWFAFIAIALIGYGAILRREARKRSTGDGEPATASVLEP